MHIITMLLLLSILILVHEFGHFIVARWLGIKVERFGFGLPFGPTLYESQWGDTKVCVHSFLLGGYVSFPDDDPDSDIPSDSMERIANRKVWERLCVVSAGVIANAILAYIIVIMVAGFSGGVPTGKYDIFIQGVQHGENIPAASIGIKSDDKVVSVNGVKVDSLYKFVETAQQSKKYDGRITPKRLNEQIEKISNLNPGLSAKLSKDGYIPLGVKINLPEYSYEAPVKVSSDLFAGVKEEKPQGIELSERQKKLREVFQSQEVFQSDGSTTLADVAMATGDTVHPIDIVVERNGQLVDLPKAYTNEDGIIGVKLRVEEVMEVVKSPADAITKAWDYLYRNGYYMIKGLSMIVTGKIPLSDIHGIVAVTKVGSDIIEQKGIWDGLLLTALISIDLAIVNLLPIPALDGGHVMFLIIEALRGKPVEERTQEAFAKYGFAFLIGLMLIIVFNDIFALMTDKL